MPKTMRMPKKIPNSQKGAFLLTQIDLTKDISAQLSSKFRGDTQKIKDEWNECIR